MESIDRELQQNILMRVDIKYSKIGLFYFISQNYDNRF